MTTTKIAARGVSMQFVGDGQRVTGSLQAFSLEASGPGVGEILKHAVGLLGRAEMIPEAPELLNAGLARARLAQDPIAPRLPAAHRTAPEPLTERQEQALAALRHAGPMRASEVAKVVWGFTGYGGAAVAVLRSLSKRELAIHIDGKWVAR
jgi:hypothetical protein